MRRKTLLWTTVGIVGFFTLIFDSSSAVSAAQEGIILCLQVVIPSLFPYFIFSNILVSSIRGSWAIPIVGFLGGYPAGAQAIYTGYQNKKISKDEALNLLGYCNNAGPAFIFGMLSKLFHRWYIPWIILGIQGLSAITVKLTIIKGKTPKFQAQEREFNISSIISKSAGAIVIVSSWVILFKIVIEILNKRLLYQFSPLTRLITIGVLELTNGCCSLQSVNSQTLRFLLSTAFINFGGICVTMQTAAVTKELGISKYILCKFLQTLFAILISWIVSFVLF